MPADTETQWFSLLGLPEPSATDWAAQVTKRYFLALLETEKPGAKCQQVAFL